MHDYEAECVCDYVVSCHDYLEEDYTLEDDYSRESNDDYAVLAYRHYA